MSERAFGAVSAPVPPAPPAPPAARAPAAARWGVLALLSLVTFSGYFVYDSISPIAPILRQELKVGATAIGLFGSLYSLPNIVMVLLGGILIDRLGSRRSGLLFAVLCFLGTAVTAWGRTIEVMLAGRVIFGIGAESLILAQNKITARWFKGRELALAMGLGIAICRAGSLLAFGGMAWIAEGLGWRGALWFAALLTLLALGAFLAYGTIERRAERRAAMPPETTEAVARADVWRFGPSFWYITALCVLFYSAVFPFTYFSTDFFAGKWGLSLPAAGRTTSVLVLAAIVLTPLFGHLVDRRGRRASLLVLGSLLFAPTYFVLGATHLTPLVPMAVMGMAFSLVPAALWPAIPLLVEERRLGTAYGLLTMIQNAGMTVVPLVGGALSDATGGYTAAMYLFGGLGTGSLVFSLLLWRRERGAGGHGLERPSGAVGVVAGAGSGAAG